MPASAVVRGPLPSRRGRGRPSACRPTSCATCASPLEDLWGAAGRLVGERAGTDPAALARGASRAGSSAAPDPRVVVAALAARADAAPAVPAVADAVGLGERQLRRAFTAGVGYGPRTFARVMRFRRALELLERGEAPARAAADAGYADQPHMTREARRAAGRTPGAFRAGRSGAPRPVTSG